MTEVLAAVRHDIARFIQAGEGDFDRLALRLFRAQIAQNTDYRAVVGEGAARVHAVSDIPAVPVALWRDLDLTSFPAHRTATVFRTSGTTGRRGVVRRHDTELYDLGSRPFAESVVGPIPQVGVSLVPDATDSSLGHMCRSFAPALSQRFTAARGVDAAGAWTDLRRLAEAGAPVFLPGTALALAALVEEATGPVPLPAGSIVMVTGGFKGTVAKVSAAELREALVALFPGAKVVEEYGMTELSSQLWAEGPGRPLRPPPWLRVDAVDPRTQRPAEVGLLRFVDLANVDTVLAIETRDVGRVLADGRVELHGRLPGAPARGCSLTVEEAMGTFSTASIPAVGTLVPRVEGRLHAADHARAKQLVHALGLLPPPTEAWGQGLHLNAIQVELAHATKALTVAGLTAELRSVPPTSRPASVAIVAAEGVFSAALEWVILCLAAGMSVRWKPPVRWPTFARAVESVLVQQGFPLTVDPSRDLGTPECIVVFGADATIEAVTAAHPSARVVGYGHRFGLAVVEGAPQEAIVNDLVVDHLRYDTRGCMAPAGVWVVNGSTAAWGSAIAQSMMEQTRSWHRGALAAADGPEWRRRLALGRARRGAWSGADWAVAAMDLDAWVPAALPWFVSVVDAGDTDSALAALERYAARVSVLALAPQTPSRLAERVDRTCAVGTMQSPPFPRLHDGAPMLAHVCGWRG